jgi:hypothetical protein
MRSATAVAAAVLVISSATSSSTAQTVPAPWGELRAGPNAVGLRRDTTGGLVLTIWYPALASARSSPRVTLEDYARLAQAKIEGSRSARASQVAFEARRGGAPARGRFPMVLWSGRYDVELAQSVTSELLASHGFVVATVRSIGAQVPPPFQASSEPAARAGIADSALAQLESGLELAKLLPFADSSRIALLAWSYGGEMATRLERTHPEIDGNARLRCRVEQRGAVRIAFRRRGFAGRPPIGAPRDGRGAVGIRSPRGNRPRKLQCSGRSISVPARNGRDTALRPHREGSIRLCPRRQGHPRRAPDPAPTARGSMHCRVAGPASVRRHGVARTVSASKQGTPAWQLSNDRSPMQGDRPPR